ncbi:putative integral membrane protein [Sphingobium yanoikuyae]|uniref:Putative integral membrane protein n=1 Tax=Sphingobium yanoikuyae TaxID=13690 RepID=A0A084EN20_SPHYA|nr:RcnB family protein [Sphingobium yanoikuyae]KEZ19362.1 putative integral membrane protein [Sphingobium yanoikuyae]
MKKAVLYLSIALIVAPDIAIAQQGGRPPSGGGARPSPSTRPAPAPSRPGGSVQPSRPGGPSTQPSRPGASRPQPPRPGQPSPGPGQPGGPAVQPPRPGGPSPQPPRPGGPGVQPPRPGQPHRPGAGRPPNFRPIPGPAFRYPHGYRYRRWTVGLFLPAIFFSTAYYYDDYWRMGLGAPPYGYRWIRYGPDMLLVDVRSRRVVDVVYGAFY